MNNVAFKAIEKNGTGVKRTYDLIEKNGTGVSSMIEKNGTGIRRFSLASAIAVALVSSPYAFAADFSGVVNRSGQTVTISITNGEFLFSGSGHASRGYSEFTINAIELPGRNGSKVAAEGHGTGVAAEGHGTGIAAEGHGTGVSAEGHGTGVAAEGHGTGVAAEGHGTGVAKVCHGNNIVLAEGHGTGIAAEGHGTGVAAEGHGTGVAAEGHGTGVAAEGHGTGVAAEGHGTGLAAEGHGTGVSSRQVRLDSESAFFSFDIPIGEGRNVFVPDNECGPGSVMLSWGLAELAFNGNTASVLLYGVRSDGTVGEFAALELPVIVQ